MKKRSEEKTNLKKRSQEIRKNKKTNVHRKRERMKKNVQRKIIKET